MHDSGRIANLLNINKKLIIIIKCTILLYDGNC